MQALELTCEQAALEAEHSIKTLLHIAQSIETHRADITTTTSWQADAKTYTYHTHVAIPDVPHRYLSMLAAVFSQAPALAKQPWYPQFMSGALASTKTSTQGVNHQESLGMFDVGLGKPRHYCQLLSHQRVHAHTEVIALRSITPSLEEPSQSKRAYCLHPSGEVLNWENNTLHWHHICTTPGAALLPPTPDRWLINFLRTCKLDQAERKTYTTEATQLRRWLSNGKAFENFVTQNIT